MLMIYLISVLFIIMFALIYIFIIKRPVKRLIKQISYLDRTTEQVIIIAELKDVKNHINFWATRGKKYNTVIAKAEIYLSESRNRNSQENTNEQQD